MQRGTSLTIREISASFDSRLEASGGDRARIKKYTEAIVLYRRSIESLAGVGEELQVRVHEVPRDLVGFAAAPTAGSTVETAATPAGISVEDALHEELDTHHKMPRQHKQSAPRAGEGPPVGAARLHKLVLNVPDREKPLTAAHGGGEGGGGEKEHVRTSSLPICRHSWVMLLALSKVCAHASS